MIISEMFPFSALFGSTVDTCLRQCASWWASVFGNRHRYAQCKLCLQLVAAQHLARQWIHVLRQLGASCAVLAPRMALVKGRG